MIYREKLNKLFFETISNEDKKVINEMLKKAMEEVLKELQNKDRKKKYDKFIRRELVIDISKLSYNIMEKSIRDVSLLRQKGVNALEYLTYLKATDYFSLKVLEAGNYFYIYYIISSKTYKERTEYFNDLKDKINKAKEEMIRFIRKL